MKPTRLLFLCFLTIATPSGADPSGGKDRHLPQPVGVPVGVGKPDWSGIRAAYEAGQHAFQPVAGQEGVWQARNPGQQWLTTFDRRGFMARPRGGGWSWGLELLGYGFGDRQIVANVSPSVKAAGQRLSYQWDANVEEWFVNDRRGLEHGFTVAQRPERSGQATPSALGFTLDTRGTLRPVSTSDAQGVCFVDAAGAAVLNYSGLKVWDADGITLPSRFESAGDNRVRLLVDERSAHYPITIDPIAQQAFLKPSAVGIYDGFGSAVAVSGDTAVVGIPGDDTITTGVNGTPVSGGAPRFESGAAYVFVRSGGAWTQQAWLKPAAVGTSQGGDQFGTAVAIQGDTIIVGAPLEGSNTTGVNGTPHELGPWSGAAYVFTRSGTTWTQQAFLKPAAIGTSAEADSFGFSVAVSGDVAVVGALQEDSSTTGVNGTPNELATFSGAAYVFARSGTAWTQQAFLKPAAVGTTQAGDNFGRSVAIWGETVIVGAPYEDSNTLGMNGTPNELAVDAGAAYVFTRSGTTWTQQAFLKPGAVGTTQTGDRFGRAVAIWDNTVVVGAYGEASDTLGVNGMPNELAGGAGAAYVFTRDGTVWTQQAWLKPAAVGTSQAGDGFGSSVAIWNNTVVVGAQYEDSNTLGMNGTPNELAGGAGAAYLFTRSGTTWTQQAFLKPAAVGTTQAEDGFGSSVAVSTDIVVVGAPGEDSNTTGVNGTPVESGSGPKPDYGAGAAYVFTVPPAPGFATWAAANIPTGQDAAFGGDWNRDGIQNGVAYVFGSTRFDPAGQGKVPIPPSIPADVNVYLDRSNNLSGSPGWVPIASWVNGASPTFASDVSIVSGEVRDLAANGPRAYYRYRVVQR